MRPYILVTFVLFLIVLPLQAQRWGGNRLCTEPLKSEDLRLIQGSVEDVQVQAGKGMPTMVVKGVDGSLISIAVGPYSAWLDGNFTVQKGDQVTVNAFSCRRDAERLAAVEIMNKTRGTQLALRDEYGRPESQGQRGGRRAGRLGRPESPKQQ